jgi:Mg2+-importing ATPase
VQNLGGMNVLCTDKTGTLTDDHVKLHSALDSLGAPALLPLAQGFRVS